MNCPCSISFGKLTSFSIPIQSEFIKVGFFVYLRQSNKNSTQSAEA